MAPCDHGVEPEADVRPHPRTVVPDQGCACPAGDAVRLMEAAKGDQGREPRDADPVTFGAALYGAVHYRRPETRARRAARHKRRGWAARQISVLTGIAPGDVPTRKCAAAHGPGLKS